MLLNLIARSVLGTIGFALLLFLPAGTIDWPEAWVFLAIFIVSGVGIGLWLLRTNPALLAARMAPMMGKAQRPRDRALMAAIMAVFFSWYAFIAFDARRFHWSQVPVWLEAVGALLIVISFLGNITVLKANSFASVEVRIQPGQTVVSTGPYAVVRHPMYAYVLPMFVGTPLLLGSFWGLVWLLAMVPLMGWRAVGEEAVLLDGLPGYRDYAARVRYRLIPGIW